MTYYVYFFDETLWPKDTCKGKHLSGAGCHGGTYYCADRHGSGEGVESFISWSRGSKRRVYVTLGTAWAYETSKPTTVTSFLQQGHSYSKEVTSPGHAAP